jgi:hypothetical protein
MGRTDLGSGVKVEKENILQTGSESMEDHYTAPLLALYSI